MQQMIDSIKVRLFCYLKRTEEKLVENYAAGCIDFLEIFGPRPVQRSGTASGVED